MLTSQRAADGGIAAGKGSNEWAPEGKLKMKTFFSVDCKKEGFHKYGHRRRKLR